MLHLGLDLSRKRLDVCVLNEAGTKLAVTQALPISTGSVTSPRKWRPSADR